GLVADQVVGEPCGRDTAACIGLGAALIARHDPAGVMIVMPADHVIEPAQEFRRAAQAAEQLADENPTALITFGIVPTYPATGYGYIHRGTEIPGRLGATVYRVHAFREKPDAELAEQFIASGEYFWNGGIFVWKVSAIRAALAEFQPRLFDAVERIAAAWPTAEREPVLLSAYEALGLLTLHNSRMGP